MNVSKSLSSLNLSRQSSCSDITQNSLENLTDLNLVLIRESEKADKAKECEKYVTETQTPTHKHFELTCTDKKKKIKLKFKKDLKVRIKADSAKREDLEAIEKSCFTFNKIPDWGYGKCDQRYDAPVQGWQNFLDLVQDCQKYEMAENHICERHNQIQKEKAEARKQMKIQALQKRINICCGQNLVHLMKEKKCEKSKHQIIMEDLEIVTQEQKKQREFMQRQKEYFQSKTEAIKNRQLSQEKQSEPKRLSWIEKPKNFPNSILQEKREQEQKKTHLFLKKGSGAQETPIKQKLAKIVLRKSAPQVIQSRLQKKKVEVVADEQQEQQNKVPKFVKDVTIRQRKSFVTPPSFEDNITTASNTTFSRQFGNSVMPTSNRQFSDVNQRVEEESEEDGDCPFDMAIEDIQEEKEEKSSLKLKKQRSSDTILQMQGYRTQNYSRNVDNNGVAIRHFKRHSHVGNNTPQNEQLDFRPRNRNSDSLKPYMVDQLTNNTSAVQSNSKFCASSQMTKAVDFSSNMSVKAKQAQFKEIIRKRSKSNKGLFKILKEKRQSVKPESDAASVRYSEPLPFNFTQRNSGGRMNLEDFSKMTDKQSMLPALNANTTVVSPRVSKKAAKMVVPLSKIQFTTDNTVLNSFRN